ncbi:nucleoside-diphosphate-sugar epimerase [Pseudohyphozyma bogoriensis]|nr:nucleoside-diphosphate-sugar epimerase [Pseudohyphozyma bogoriensis]
MNVVVTGATGSAGSEALRQALLHPAVGSVTALVRCPLPPHIAPSAPNPKLRTILHSDFNSYPPDLMTQLKDTDAVLWCQGASGASVSAEALEKVSVDYPVAAAKAFAEMERKVVFCYLSAVAVKQDPSNCNRFTIGKAPPPLSGFTPSVPL